MSVRNDFNFLKRVMKHPCAIGGPLIIIETAIEAGIPVLFSLNQFSCLDILKTRAGISWKCGRQLKANIEQAHGRSIVNAGHSLYHLGPNLGERALWWWFVAGLGTGFIADWTSLMYQESGCEGPESTHWSVAANTLFLDPGGPYGVFIDRSPPGACAESVANEIKVPGGCTATITYEMLWEPFRADLDPTCSVTSWLQDEAGTQYMPMTTEWKKTDSGGNAFSSVVHLASHFGRSKVYTIQWINNAGLCGARRGHVHVTTTGRRVEPIPIGCKPKPVSVPAWFSNPISSAF